MSEPTYDSRADTLEHIQKVSWHLHDAIRILLCRAETHDASKLQDPEKAVFDVVTPRLKKLTYGSAEYKKSLAEMGEALEHHYRANSHHPEHYTHGICDMDLFDLVEMLCDWKAATDRHEDGDMLKSLEHNKERFGISPQLYGILKNTARNQAWI